MQKATAQYRNHKQGKNENQYRAVLCRKDYRLHFNFCDYGFHRGHMIKNCGKEIFNQTGHLEWDRGYLVRLKLKYANVFVIIELNGGGLSEIAITSKART